MMDLVSAWEKARGLGEGYGHDGPGICLGNSQTEAKALLSQGGHSNPVLFTSS